LGDPPRLVAARYQARLEGDHLIGSATWTVRHSRDRPGLMPLEPMTAALRSLAWSDGALAVAGELDPAAGAGVQLPGRARGERTLEAGWSSRGRPEPGGTSFDLGWPECGVAHAELDLPVGAEPVVPRDEGAVVGPRPGADPARRAWTVALGGG